MSNVLSDVKLARKYLSKEQQARDRGIVFKLSLTSYRNLISAKKCFYTGITLSDVEGAGDQLTIDRIDNTRGYEHGNVVACCLAFNQLKGKLEIDGAIHLPIFQKALVKMIAEVNKVRKPKEPQK